MRQCIAFWAFRRFQKRQPPVVEVLGKTYKTDRRVFNPRFYLTSKLMARNLDVGEGASVLDMGSGSGVQAVTAAGKARKVIAVDINYDAARMTKENARANGVGKKVFALQGDLFAALNPRAKFDIIIFTPPYMEGTPEKDIERAWFDPGKALAQRFLEEAGAYLNPGGHVLMVYSSIAGNVRVLEIAERLGWSYTIAARKKSILETFYIYRLQQSELSKRKEWE